MVLARWTRLAIAPCLLVNGRIPNLRVIRNESSSIPYRRYPAPPKTSARSQVSRLMEPLRVVDALYVDRDRDAVRSPAEYDPLERAHVAEVAAPGDRHVIAPGQHVVRGVEVEPPRAWHVDGRPRVGCVGPDETGLTHRRLRLEVAGHIAGRQTE